MREISRIKSGFIFFDLDGTLVDSLPALYNSYLEFLKSFGIVGTPEEFESLNGPSLEEIVALLKKKYKIQHSVDALLKQYQDEVRRRYLTEVKGCLNAEEVLMHLKNRQKKCFLVSSNSPSIAQPLIRNLGWEPFFVDYVYGPDVTRAKPDPAIYQMALKKSGANLSDVVVVEDSINGIKSAGEAGLKVIAFSGARKDKKLFEKTGAVFVISDLLDLVRIIE